MAQEAQDSAQWQDALDRHTHVFVVRIWLEPREIAGAAVEWRGVIEHLPSQERRYLNDLTVIAHFITPYLDSMGVAKVQVIPRGRTSRLRRWLNHRKQSG